MRPYYNCGEQRILHTNTTHKVVIRVCLWKNLVRHSDGSTHPYGELPVFYLLGTILCQKTPQTHAFGKPCKGCHSGGWSSKSLL